MSLTVPAPDGIDAAGRSAVMFVTAIADTAAPKVTELSGATHISCVIDGFEATVDVPTSRRRKYCAKQSTQRVGAAAYSIAPVIVLDDPQGTAASGYDYLDTLEEGVEGFLLERRGIDFDEPLATGQKVNVYPVKLAAIRDVPLDLETEDGQKFQIELHFIITGDVQRRVALAA